MISFSPEEFYLDRGPHCVHFVELAELHFIFLSGCLSLLHHMRVSRSEGTPVPRQYCLVPSLALGSTPPRQPCPGTMHVAHAVKGTGKVSVLTLSCDFESSAHLC